MKDHRPTLDDFITMCRVPEGKRIALKEHDPSWAGNKSIPKEERKAAAKALLSEDVTELAKAQELLYADNRWSILVILQALDAAGKDGTIKHVMSGVNPQGVEVVSFKQPSTEELEHDFLWRCSKALPGRGRIGIFNRSYYEEVLVVRVHPELLAAERIPDAATGKTLWEHRYEDINAFERHLTRNGTKVLKFFLNISKEEQRKRFLARINDEAKHWKFSRGDVVERGYWDQYTEAYEDALSATNTECAPWYIIPADHKWVSRALVATVMAREIKAVDLKYPELTEAQEKEIETAKKELEAE